MIIIHLIEDTFTLSKFHFAHNTLWLLHNILVFFQEFFGGKIYCYANFSIVFRPNFRGAKVSEGEKLPQAGHLLSPPPIEESQIFYYNSIILQRTFHNCYGIIQYIESLSRNRKEATLSAKCSALTHQNFSKNFLSLILVKKFLNLKQYCNKTIQFLQKMKTIQLKERTIHLTQTQYTLTRKQ